MYGCVIRGLTIGYIMSGFYRNIQYISFLLLLLKLIAIRKLSCFIYITSAPPFCSLSLQSTILSWLVLAVLDNQFFYSIWIVIMSFIHLHNVKHFGRSPAVGAAVDTILLDLYVLIELLSLFFIFYFYCFLMPFLTFF